LREDVKLRLVHSTERQPCSNSVASISQRVTVVRKACQSLGLIIGVLEAINLIGIRRFEMCAQLSHDLFLSLRGN
jgi:hypothetical protein